MRTVFLSLPSTFAVANLLRSGFFPILRQAGLHIVLLSPYAKEPSFVAEFSDPGRVDIEELVWVPQTPMEARFRSLAYLSLARRHPNRSTPILRGYLLRRARAAGKRHELTYHVKEAIAPLLSPDHWLKLADRYANGPVYSGLFERYRPELVLTSAQGVISAREIPLLRESLARGVPTLAIHMSWDQLCSKHEPGYRVDELVVWNEYMKQDAMQRFGYREDEVYVAGAPHWDLYARRDFLQSREEFCRSLGLAPAKKIIALMTVPPEIYPDHNHIVETLLEAIRNNAWCVPAQLLVRLHPLQSSQDYEAFSGRSDVVVEYPAGRFDEVNEGGLHANISLRDRQHLANTLFHADVMINYASSTTIEACVYDTPVVNIAYDGDQTPPIYGSALDGYRQEHYRRIVDTGGVRLAYSPQELLEWVGHYIANPYLDREGRRRIVKEQVEPLDGKAAKRTAEYVLRFLAGRHGIVARPTENVLHVSTG